MLVKEIADGKNKRAAMKTLLKAIANLNARYSLDTAGSPRLGPAQARVEVVIFSDFECPHCRRVAAPLTSIVKKHKEAALIYKCYPIGFHKNARRAAIAALAAGRQGQFWQMHDAIYDSDDAPTDEKLENIARRLKLDLQRWKKDMDDPALAAQVDADKREGDKANIQGTPTFFVNGLLVDDLDAVDRMIKQEIAQ
jgi:protein-disulfide isomerase